MARGERVFRLPPPFSRGPEVGFKILGFSGFDLEDPEVSEIWEGPRFDAPTLGLRDSTAGEIVLAARPFLGGRSTVNRVYFNRAVQAEGEEAEELWRYCLQSGDLMAHYGLTYTLYDLGRHREAYRHLRAYTELVPADGWAWSCLGKACEAMEATDEAESTYRKAINLDGDGITGKARDLHELAGLDPRYGPAIIQRDALFKVLDVYQLRGRSQVALLHVPAELVDRLRTQEPNAIEEEIVGAARRDFEQILQSPTVPAVTEPEWTDRVAFPLGMNDEGELFYEGSSLEGHGS